MKTTFFYSFMTMIFFFIFCSSAAAAVPNPIRFATEATYPPFEFINDKGELTGFDVELARALCEQLKTACTFANQPFSSLITSLNLGKFDALIAALSVTEARQKQVSFTDSYYRPSAAFVGLRAKQYTLANINGHTVGVQSGSTFADYLRDVYHDKITVKTYASVQDALLDLTAGRVDLVLADTPLINTWLNQNDNNKTFGVVANNHGKLFNDHYFGAGYGIAVRKDDMALRDALNQALAAIKANGTYAKITRHYFGQ